MRELLIGDKVKIVKHPFYQDRYARIINIDTIQNKYKVKIDIDEQEIWVSWEQIIPAYDDSAVLSGYYDDHYRKMKIQPIEFAQDLLTPEEMIGAMKFNIIKYSMRAGVKEGEPAEKDIVKKERYQEWLKTLYDGKRIEV